MKEKDYKKLCKLIKYLEKLKNNVKPIIKKEIEIRLQEMYEIKKRYENGER